jgi:hypothetical protein
MIIAARAEKWVNDRRVRVDSVSQFCQVSAKKTAGMTPKSGPIR